MARLKKRPDGRYQRRVRLEDGRYKMAYGRTMAELSAAEQQIRDQDRQGLKIGDTTLVGEWAGQWLSTYKKGLRAKTVEMYRSTYNCHICDQLGGMVLKDVRPVHIQQVMLSVASQSESLQRKVLITLQQLFSTAAENRLILRSPVEGVKIVKQKRPEKKKYLTQEESARLMQVVQDSRARAFCGLCLYCGLRREEALGLQWRDIDGDVLTVNRALSFVGGQPDPNMDLKTKAAHRQLPIPQPLKEILEELPRTSIWVIPAVRGRMTASAYDRLWQKVEAVWPAPIHAHMLRHTYATMLYKAGVDLRTAQKLLGHSSITMTANIYTHLEAEDSLSAGAQIDQYLQSSHRLA